MMTTTTPTPAEVTTLCTRLAMAGHHVIKGTKGDFTVCKYGLTRYCADFAELQAFAVKLGVIRHE